MHQNPSGTIQKLEKLTAWHRINAEYAGADRVWELRLRAAKDLERRAAEIRTQLRVTGEGGKRPQRKCATGGQMAAPRGHRWRPWR
jgi:hypothetical protein